MPETTKNKMRKHLAKEIEGKKEAFSLALGEEMSESVGFILNRVEDARIQRQTARTEFDNLSYEEDYLLNERAGYSHLRPKINDDEVRIVGGTTEKKTEVAINELMRLNITPEVRAIDENDREITNLGRDFQDIVERTNQVEKDKDKRPDILRELITQRALFLEEIYVDRTITDKNRFDPRLVGITNQKPRVNKTRRIQRPEKRILSGLQVYLGDIRLPAYKINEQPFIVKHFIVNYSAARQVFENYKNWKFVQPGQGSPSHFFGLFDYRVDQNLQSHQVEILVYEDAIEDEYQVFINSVPMLDNKEALPWEKEGYNITMAVAKPIRVDFAYGKSPVSSAKTLQALSDEMIRNLVRKFRQAIEPPIGIAGSGSIFSKDMFEPGAVTEGVTKDNFTSLIDHNGVTQSEFNMLGKIEDMAKEFIGQSDAAQGLETPGEKTAFETKKLLEAGAVNLGLLVSAYIKTIQDVTMLRIFNILENETFPIKKTLNPNTNQIEDVYRRYTIRNTKLSSGSIGDKTIVFSGQTPDDDQQEEIFQFEQAEKKRGRNREIRVINAEKLRQLPHFFEVVATSKPVDSSDLDKALFNDKLAQAQAISQSTGVPLNADGVIRDYEQAWDTENMFQQAAPGEERSDPAQAEQLLKQIDSLEKSGAGQAVKQSEGVTPNLGNLTA